MASWIKEKDGIEWFDEAYTIKQTNQSPEQLDKKARAKKIRRFKQRNGGYWYARDDVEALRAAFLKRSETSSKAAKKRGPTQKQLEARYAKQAEKLRQTSRHFHGGPLLAHGNRVTIAEIFANERKRKAAKDEAGDS